MVPITHFHVKWSDFENIKWILIYKQIRIKKITKIHLHYKDYKFETDWVILLKIWYENFKASLQIPLIFRTRIFPTVWEITRQWKSWLGWAISSRKSFILWKRNTFCSTIHTERNSSFWNVLFEISYIGCGRNSRQRSLSASVETKL